MTIHQLTIPYGDDLLLSLKTSPERFESEARLLLAVKLYELGRITTGRAARLAGMDRVSFLFELRHFGFRLSVSSRTSSRKMWQMPSSSDLVKVR